MRHTTLAILTVLFSGASLFAAAPVRTGSPLVPGTDPVDGLSWRGDQFYAASELPAQGGHFGTDGVFHVRDVRSGFTPVDGRWKVRLGRARIDAKAVRRVTLLMTPFDPRKYASHAALLFEFDGAGAVDPDTGRPISGIVISAEARIREGEAFNFSQGLSGKSPLIHVVSTWDDYKQSLLEVWKDKLERFVLRVSPAEARGALEAGLEVALRADRTARYRLLDASCATQAVDILNAGLSPERRIQRKWFFGLILRPGVTVAGWLPGFLTRRGYVEERLPDLP